MTVHKIIEGDSRKLNKIPDKSVQLIITSPPYWQLKDYGTENQIGFHQNYEDYINNLNLVWKECQRVLADGCKMCINIGDQFARSAYYGRYKVIPIRTEIIKCCEMLGMDYLGAIIWQKTTSMHTTGGGAIMGSFPYPRNGILKMDYEFILLFKKLGTAPKPSILQKKESILTKEEWNQYFSSHWNIKGVKQTDHIAMFPEELPKRLIKMFSFVGETILDPFLGSGTTTLVAKNLGRNSIGYEINPDFIPIIKERLSQSSINEDKLEYLTDSISASDLDFSHLPYVFYDPHKLDAQLDIKLKNFGSKIDVRKVRNVEKIALYKVSEIISPEIIVLSNGNRLKLIGVKNKEDTLEEAINFLKLKMKNRRVFLKYDILKYDDSGNLLCYLYLDNKTFINRHLIKSGLVAVDQSFDYRLKAKFLALRNLQDDKETPEK